MWLAVIAVAAGLAVGLACGGRLRHLATSPIRWIPLLGAGAAAEAVAASWMHGIPGLAVMIAGYVVMAAFAVGNLAFTGSALVAVGLLANLLVIGLNAGMPVRGAPPGSTFGPRHHGERPGDRLTGLADVISIRPLGEVVSAGDVLLAAGVATMAAVALRPGRRTSPAASEG